MCLDFKSFKDYAKKYINIQSDLILSLLLILEYLQLKLFKLQKHT